jgi:ABC-type antimicrobial peptide transport system permease subunit
MKISTSLPVEVMKMAFDSIAGHKFRSALTILGIVVGIITAVVVASILTGMRQSIVSIVEEYGTNNIYVFHLSMGGGGNNRDERNRKPLTDADADAIMNQSTTIDDITLINPGIGNFGPSFDDNLKYEDRNYRWAKRRWRYVNYDRILNLGSKKDDGLRRLTISATKCSRYRCQLP